jgi:hypothetical protein
MGRHQNGTSLLTVTWDAIKLVLKLGCMVLSWLLIIIGKLFAGLGEGLHKVLTHKHG